MIPCSNQKIFFNKKKKNEQFQNRHQINSDTATSLHSIFCLFESNTAKYIENVSFDFSFSNRRQTIVNEIVHFLVLKEKELVERLYNAGLHAVNLRFKTKLIPLRDIYRFICLKAKKAITFWPTQLYRQTTWLKRR